jgi:hypothetical protein
MRIAFFVGSFPEISETFILYQITGLIDLGHDVQIFSEYHPKQTAVVHEYVHTYLQLQEPGNFLSGRSTVKPGSQVTRFLSLINKE